jgi:hypothetical protein
MENKGSTFRDRLVESQPTTPALREEFCKQLEGVLVRRLSPRARLLNWVLAPLWAGAAGACVWSAVAHHGTPKATFDFWINLGVYFTLFVLMAAGSARNALKGEHTWRAYFGVGGMLYTAAGITMTLALLRGMRASHDPASTFGAIVALTFLVVCLGWALQNRIDGALLSTREQMLRLESRMAELAERLEKAR